MKKKIMKKWVEALRSGEFEQGESYLDRNGKYCCLGVLCALAVNEGVVRVSESAYTGTYDYGDCRMDGSLPKEVMKWSEIKTDMGVLASSGGKTSLATMNDQGVSFKEISRIIEQNWKEL